MLFYNLDTPDLTGNKHTHREQRWDAAVAGEAGMGARGCAGLARLRPVLQGVKMFWEDARGAGAPKGRNTAPLSSFSSPICL